MARLTAEQWEQARAEYEVRGIAILQSVATPEEWETMTRGDRKNATKGSKFSAGLAKPRFR